MGSSGVFSASCSIASGHAKVVAAYPRRCVEFGCLGDYRLDGVSSNLVFSSGKHLSLGRSGLGRCWKTPILKAAMEGYGVEEHEDLSKDALDTTIDKSNIVLENQKDLLRLISERKKVVSLIKNSVINLEESEEHALDGDAAISSLDAAVREAVLEQQIESTSSEDAQTMEVRYVALESNVEPIERQSFDKDLHQELECNSGSTISVSQTSEEEDIGRKFWGTDSEPMPSEKYEQHEDSNGRVANLDFVKPPPLAGANAMNVILVTCECSPWIKTGGLGDVAGALPKALARRGHRVMVIMPRYSAYADAQDTGVRRRYNIDGQDMEVNFFHAYIDGVDFVFIESPIFRHTENNIYGGNRADILKRMVLFCKTAVEAPWYVPCGGVCYGDGNLVFIANDWHTALLPVYLKAYYRDHGLMQYTRAVLVIHNIAHQGRGPVDEFRIVGLPNHYLDHFKFYDPVGGEHMNIFAAGIKAADRVVTVSHGYAWEIKTSEGGWGLNNIVNENDWKLRGIVNGIDTNDWRPETDIYLQSDGYVNYTLDTLQEGKPQCKTALQRELGFPVRPDVPLVAFIGRLDHQKGIDIIGEVIPWMMDQDVQLVMLGTGRPDLEDMLRHFEGQYRDKVRGWVGFSVQTAHRITAGADILLMPSRFEPCGLNQLYAMQYATVPVVHAVGGLRDTVTPFNPFDETGLGWTFPRAEANELMNALSNCLLTYREYKKSWEGLQRRGMMQDLSWDHAAQLYEEVLVAAKYQW